MDSSDGRTGLPSLADVRGRGQGRVGILRLLQRLPGIDMHGTDAYPVW